MAHRFSLLPLLLTCAVPVGSSVALLAQSSEHTGNLQGIDGEAAASASVALVDVGFGRSDAFTLAGDPSSPSGASLVRFSDPMDVAQRDVVTAGVRALAAYGGDRLMTLEGDDLIEWTFDTFGSANSTLLASGLAAATGLREVVWSNGSGLLAHSASTGEMWRIDEASGSYNVISLSTVVGLKDALVIHRMSSQDPEIAVLHSGGVSLFDSESLVMTLDLASNGGLESFAVAPAEHGHAERLIWIAEFTDQEQWTYQWFCEFDEFGMQTVLPLFTNTLVDVCSLKADDDDYHDVALVDSEHAWFLHDRAAESGPGDHYFLDQSGARTAHCSLWAEEASGGNTVAVGPSARGSITCGDLDRDSDHDLVMVHPTNGLWIVPGETVDEHDPDTRIRLDHRYDLDESWLMGLPNDPDIYCDLTLNIMVPASQYIIDPLATHVAVKITKQATPQSDLDANPVYEMVIPLSSGVVLSTGETHLINTVWLHYPAPWETTLFHIKFTLVDDVDLLNGPSTIYTYAHSGELRDTERDSRWAINVFGGPGDEPDDGSGNTEKDNSRGPTSGGSTGGN